VVKSVYQAVTIKSNKIMSETKSWPSYSSQQNSDQENTITKGSSADDSYLIEQDGIKYAGCHIILDLWEAENLNDIELIELCLHQAIKASGATLLHIHLHHFSEGGGVSGVAVLAESHISIHTWPEKNYAAFDVFMCGNTKPNKTIPIFVKTFNSQRYEVKEILRGKMS
jgi:S-adenosylmethionine decarboxylase